MRHILVTGGLGFIGTNLLSRLSRDSEIFIHNVDHFSLGVTYFEEIVSIEGQSRIKTYLNDINDQDLLGSILQDNNIKQVYHLAAESHVDRSIDGPRAFYESNVMGTLSAVEACRAYIEKKEIRDFRILHVSTDEVFGDLSSKDPPFSENSSYRPSSPYSASKAASDFIITSWYRTFGFPGIITNCSNNFGPGQNAEKLIPTIINALVNEEKIPIYGTGNNIRDWLFVDTHAAYLEAIMASGAPGNRYLIGGDMELTNLELVNKIVNIFNSLCPEMAKNFDTVVEFVSDRKGHDQRYAIDTTTLKKQFPEVDVIDFEYALGRTVEFYLASNRL